MRWLVIPAVTLAVIATIACTPMNPHPMDMTQAVENAKSNTDHQALAAHYLEEAASLDKKAAEHKQLAAQYKARAYLYGKQADTFLQHCNLLIRNYEQAADINRQMAKMHQDMASGTAP
ncbi:MAG: hypothetical protein EPN21_00835 [Methylococcaceae bacterium]|nr:MAG: hypothetical protein EPN21_00835 [Methylococcaceae bacterium]